MDRRTQRRGWLRFLSLITLSALAFCTILLSPFLSDDCTAIEFTPVQTRSQGYQPQFQVSGNNVYYVWHEYDGPFRQVFTAEMNINGTAWRAEKRTSGQYDKVFPQLQVFGNKIYYVRQQPDATRNRQIWTAVTNKHGAGWKPEKRTRSPHGKYDPQLQIVGNRVYYVWHEDHGRTEPILVAIETLKEVPK